MIVDVYQYDRKFDLIYEDNQFFPKKDNSPMQKNVLKIHKGIDNTLYFRVRDRDFKKKPVDHLQVRARFMHQDTHEIVLEKYLRHTTCRGEMQLEVYEGDLVNIDSGFYYMTLLGDDPEVIGNFDTASTTSFYTDANSEIVYQVEISGKGAHNTFPTMELNTDDWLPINPIEQPFTSYSTAVPANKIKNHRNSLHTFAVYGTGFTGHLEVLGSLDMNPPSDLKTYFPVDVAPGTNKIYFDDFKGVDAFTIRANLFWVRFRLVYDRDIPVKEQGTITKILWRS